MGGGLAGAIFSLLLVAACAAPKPAPERVLYDLGQLLAPATGVPAMRVAVSMPGWLDTGDIAYRLAYEDASRLRQYAGSRWAGRPSQLVTSRLSSRFSSPPAGGAVGCTLQVELDEFAQHFGSASASTQEMTGRWQISGATGQRLSGGAIRLSEPAGGDAPSGVKAAARLVGRLADELISEAGKLSACGH